MKLIPVEFLTPLRDEKQVIYKWESRAVLLNPKCIESVSFVEEISKAVILLTSGRSVPINGTVEEFANLFAYNTRGT